MREVALRQGRGGRLWEELSTLLPFPMGPFYGRELRAKFAASQGQADK